MTTMAMAMTTMLVDDGDDNGDDVFVIWNDVCMVGNRNSVARVFMCLVY